MTYDNEPAIGCYDQPPLQTLALPTSLGVFAAHLNGTNLDTCIDHVEFSINGGAPIGVNSRTANKSTAPINAPPAGHGYAYPSGVNDFNCVIDPGEFPDGPITIAATIFPVKGQAKTLAPLTCFANAHGSLNPSVQTVSTAADLLTALGKIPDGGTIYLTAGKYLVPTAGGAVRNNSRWITIAAAPGLTADQVTIVATPLSGRMIFRTNYLKFQGLTLDAADGCLYCTTQSVWLDRCVLTFSGTWNPAPAADPGIPIRAEKIYVTDSIATKTIYGFVDCDLVRNCQVHEITGDAFQCSQAVLNCLLWDMAGTLSHHADVYQMFGAMDNVVVAGVTTWNISGTQGLFLQPTIPGQATTALTNSAFVDLIFKPNDANGLGGPAFCQLQDTLKNILFDNWDTRDQQLIIRSDVTTGTGAFSATDVLLRNCVLHLKQNMKWPAGVAAENCSTAASDRLNWAGLAAA